MTGALPARPDALADLNGVLRQVHEFLTRFVAFPTHHAAVATSLWVAHAHVVDTFDSTPRLAFLSPEPGSGKSRALEVIGPMVPHPMHAVNATPAALFRSVSDLDNRPTIMFDEIDTVFGPKAKENEEVRGFLNAGHRRSGVAYRCVGLGTSQKVMAFPAFCAVAIAGLSDVPDTIATRAVIVRMRRRAPHERVEPFRERLHETEGHQIAHRLSTALGKLRLSADPVLPDGVTDRPADVWEPLVSIAQAAGGDWPDLADAACLHFVLNTSTAREPSLAVRLLDDLRNVFATHGDPDAMPTATLLDSLHRIEEAPWSDLRGKPLDARGLSRYLHRYEIKPVRVRDGEDTVRGYRREHLWDAWVRYLPALRDKSATSATSATNATGARHESDSSATDPSVSAAQQHRAVLSVADVADVADLSERAFGGSPRSVTPRANPLADPPRAHHE